MTCFVNADSFEMRRLFDTLKCEYEKCNFWPMYADGQEMIRVLFEERRELQTAYDEYKAVKDAYKIDDSYKTIDEDSDECWGDLLRGHTVKIMLEAIQIIAVLDKWGAKNEA